MPNHLHAEKSPYLLQHSSNPVDWHPWGQGAFDAARTEDKPIFLSIGYSTCHWCHVMAHESFEDETAAEAINRVFIPVKVDREERPDVDAVYMAACMAMTGSGGWPLTVLLTPDQKPFWAGTYLPKPTLLSLILQVERLWKENRAELLSAGESLTAHLQREEAARPGTPTRAMVNRGAAQYAQLFDREWGGFGQAPKFPTPHNLLFLMGYARRTGANFALEMVNSTLDAMYRGGLFDHIGGGFSRYSTDRFWLAPHFEKMLYDNALLVLAYSKAFQLTHRSLYEQVTRRTLDYVLRELRAPQGGFYCGQDADSDGEEGKYYLFTPAQLRQVLGEEDSELFCRWYGVTEEGNFHGQSIPNLIGQPNIDSEPDGFDAIRARLREYRPQRTHLHKDDKVLTAWNGLMLAALAAAGQILDEPAYLTAACEGVDFIEQYLVDSNGRLLARWREGESAFPAKLDDYAFYAWGLLELYQATFQLRFLTLAQRLAGQLLDFFFDDTHGGFYPYASDGEQLITRSKDAYDGAMPSGNAVAALVLSRLSRLTGQSRWLDAARLQLSYLSGVIEETPAGHSFTLLTLLEELWPSAELVCVSQKIPEELTALLRQSPHPALTVLVKTPDNQHTLADLAPFTADYPIPASGTRYYLCQNGTCSSPTEHISELEAMLTRSLDDTP